MEVLAYIGIGYLVVALLLLVSIYIKAYRTKIPVTFLQALIVSFIWPLWVIAYFARKE